MSDLVIGSPDCSVTSIVNLMSQDDSLAAAFKKWKDVARQLLAPKIFIDVLDQKYILDKLSPTDMYHEILDDWKSRASEEATLLNLLTVFRKCKLNSTANHIETHFINLGLYTRPSMVVNPCDQISFSRRKALNLKRRIFNYARSLVPKLGNKCWSCIILFFLGFRYIKSFIIPLIILIFLVKCYQLTTYTNNKIAIDNKTSWTGSFRKPSCSTDTLTNTDILPKEIYKLDSVNTTEEVFTHSLTNSTREPIVWIPINATITSWKDFQILMNRNTNDSHIVDLSIVMDNPFHWSDADNLYNTHRIRSLVVNGRFSLDLLSEIIKKLPSLQNLIFDNNENKLCDRNRGQLSLVRNIPENYVYLPVLRFLYLKDFSNCVEILELLVRSYDIKRLKRLAIDEQVDNHNIHHIQELITKFDMVEVLDLHLVNHSTKYFYKSDFTSKSKISSLYFNTLSLNSNYSFISIGSNFCSHFGHLSFFENILGCLPFSEFVNLLNCAKLRRLTITLCFLKDDILEGFKLVESFPKLEYFDVRLKFWDDFNCPSISDIKRLGFRERGKTVNEFSISSNCPIRKGKDGKNKNSDFRRTRFLTKQNISVETQ